MIRLLKVEARGSAPPEKANFGPVEIRAATLSAYRLMKQLATAALDRRLGSMKKPVILPLNHRLD